MSIKFFTAFRFHIYFLLVSFGEVSRIKKYCEPKRPSLGKRRYLRACLKVFILTRSLRALMSDLRLFPTQPHEYSDLTASAL